MRCRTSINLGTIQGEQHEGAPLALTCALGTTLVSATPALAVEPVVVVATERPEFGPAASTTYLAWIVLRYGSVHPRERPCTGHRERHAWGMVIIPPVRVNPHRSGVNQTWGSPLVLAAQMGFGVAG